MKRKIYSKLKDKDGRQRVVAGHFLSFLSNVDLINKTELLKVVKKMPKGAHLHYHFNSCLRPEFLLEQARGRDLI
jgi:adenosine deaminase CECR1